MNKLKLFAVVVALGLAFSITAESADAGGFGIFRRTTTYRAVQPTRTIRAPRTVRIWSTPTVKTRSPRITGRHDWPGAIGAPSYRYQAFQDTFGYWD